MSPSRENNSANNNSPYLIPLDCSNSSSFRKELLKNARTFADPGTPVKPSVDISHAKKNANLNSTNTNGTANAESLALHEYERLSQYSGNNNATSVLKGQQSTSKTLNEFMASKHNRLQEKPDKTGLRSAMRGGNSNDVSGKNENSTSRKTIDLKDRLIKEHGLSACPKNVNSTVISGVDPRTLKDSLSGTLVRSQNLKNSSTSKYSTKSKLDNLPVVDSADAAAGNGHGNIVTAKTNDPSQILNATNHHLVGVETGAPDREVYVILDWDDTLFPTTELKLELGREYGGTPTSIHTLFSLIIKMVLN